MTSKQLPDALKIIRNRSIEKGAPLHIISDVELFEATKYKIGLEGAHQRMNAALAIKVCETWINYKTKQGMKIVKNGTIEGLATTKWPGRCQRYKSEKYLFDFCLDGAHTVESLSCCADWINTVNLNDPKPLILIFNCTHERQGDILLPPLISGITAKIIQVIFTTNTVSQTSPGVYSSGGDLLNLNDLDIGVKSQQILAEKWMRNYGEIRNEDSCSVEVVATVNDAIEVAARTLGKDGRILLTGSLHLVGAALMVLGAEVE